MLVFTDFRDNFAVIDDLQQLTPLPALTDVRTTAIASSPDVRAAEASVQQETLGVGVARGGVLPSLSFDYWYGINANDFAIYDPEGHRLLGSVAQVSLNVPLWTAPPSGETAPITSRLPEKALNGRPPPIAFPSVHRSGVTPR